MNDRRRRSTDQIRLCNFYALSGSLVSRVHTASRPMSSLTMRDIFSIHSCSHFPVIAFCASLWSLRVCDLLIPLESMAVFSQLGALRIEFEFAQRLDHANGTIYAVQEQHTELYFIELEVEPVVV